MSNFVETWKGIATALGRSERWCRYMARRTADPLPVSGAGVVEWHTTPAYAAYVRAELRHETAAGPVPGALAALTNPIFLGEAER